MGEELAEGETKVEVSRLEYGAEEYSAMVQRLWQRLKDEGMDEEAAKVRREVARLDEAEERGRDAQVCSSATSACSHCGARSSECTRSNPK